MINKTLYFCLLILVPIMLIGCAEQIEEPTKYATDHEGIQAAERQTKEIKRKETEITLAAIGDMLIHSPVYQDAKTKDGYDFTPMLSLVRPFLEDTTISIANQETMIGGEELGLSSYPAFNSPFEVGDALKSVGVDVVSLANNHTLDRGEEAIQRAISHWEQIDMMYTGAYKNEKDRDSIRVYETEEGMSLAFLSYTYGTNGIPVPLEKAFLVNIIEKERMAAEIEEAKSKADVIVLSLHFGNEYERMPNAEQKDLVQFAADHGVHLVIGHHPHVLQPVDWVEGKDGNQTFVVYSLGNFLSNQDGLYKRIGGILQVTFTKTEEGRSKTIEVKQPTFIPTYVTRSEKHTNFKIVPMYQLSNSQLPGFVAYYQEIKSHMSQWVPELKFVE